MHWKFLKKSRQVIQLAVVTWPRPLAKRFCAPVLWASPEHLSFCSMPASDKLLGEKKWLLKPAPCGSLFSCGGSKKLSCSKKCCFAHDGKNEANISEQQNHGGKKLLEKNTETFVKYSHSYLIAKKKSQWDWKNSCFFTTTHPTLMTALYNKKSMYFSRMGFLWMLSSLLVLSHGKSICASRKTTSLFWHRVAGRVVSNVWWAVFLSPQLQFFHEKVALYRNYCLNFAVDWINIIHFVLPAPNTSTALLACALQPTESYIAPIFLKHFFLFHCGIFPKLDGMFF